VDGSPMEMEANPNSLDKESLTFQVSEHLRKLYM